MKIAITGASGFIGSHLSEHLANKGYEVLSLARNQKKLREFQVPGEFVSFDLEKPQQSVANLPQDLDGFIHLAAVLFGKKEADFQNANVEAVKLLLAPLIERYGSRPFRFILMSSQAAGGPNKLNSRARREEDVDAPVSAYGRSKLEGELVLRQMLPAQWTLTIIRPPMVFGPRDPALLELFTVTKKGLAFYPGGESAKNKRFSFVSIFDLVEVIKKSLEVRTDNQIQTFFVAYPQSKTLEEIHQTLAQELGTKIRLSLSIPVWIIRAYATFCDIFISNSPLTRDKVREMSADSWEIDSSQSQTLLGHQYQHNLSTIVKTTATDYIDRQWL